MKLFIKLMLVIVSITSCSKSTKNFAFLGTQFEEKIYPLIEKKFDLSINCYGINSNKTINDPPTDKINNFYLSFISLKELTQDEGRRLLIDCIQYILNLINNDDNLREYLHNFPFSSKNLTLHLNFHDKNNERFRNGSLTYCFIQKNNVVFCSLNENYDIREKTIETYEEALEKLNNSQTSN